MTMKLLSFLTPALACIVVAGGCVEEPVGEEIPTRASELGAAPSEALPSSKSDLEVAKDQQPAATREFGGKLRLTIPNSWTAVEMTAMQRSVLLEKYTMDGEIEITISSARGGINANFSRWEGQFAAREKDEDSVDFGSATARLLTLTGDFSPGFGRLDRMGWSMLGAAFPAAPEDFYVKLTGPADRVQEVESEFRKVIRTAEFID